MKVLMGHKILSEHAGPKDPGRLAGCVATNGEVRGNTMTTESLRTGNHRLCVQGNIAYIELLDLNLSSAT